MSEVPYVHRLVVGQLASNCYLFRIDTGKDIVIIDPGEDPEYIASVISEHRFVPRAVVATHGHFDHILGSFALQAQYNIPFFIHKDDVFLVTSMQERAKHWLNIHQVDPAPVITDKINGDCTLKKFNLQIVHTPGHTPGSVCLYTSRHSALFVGDLVFKDGSVGRTDFSYSNNHVLKQSIKRIMSFPSETTILPGHGETTVLSHELAWYNEYIADG